MNRSDQNLEGFLRSNQSRYKRLAEEVEFILKDLVDGLDVKIHSVSSRVKRIDSALEKAVRKDYTDPVRQLEDLVGARVVCLFIADLDKVAGAIKKEFKVHWAENKVEGAADPATFGYMSMHYICELAPKHSGPRYDSLKGLKFEVQCRTILMDAWANVSHHLAYKGENSVPTKLRRDFNALSGLFYVADKHFELFFQEASESSAEAVRDAQAGRLGDQQELNLSTMLALFKQLYPDRGRAPRVAVSEFVEETTRAGYSTIGGLRQAIERGSSAIKEYHEQNPKVPSVLNRTHVDVGAARIELATANRGFAVDKYGPSFADQLLRYQPFLE